MNKYPFAAILACVPLAACTVQLDPLTGEKITAEISKGSQIVERQSADRIRNLSLKTAIQLSLDQNFDRMNQAYLSAVSRRDLDFSNNETLASVLADIGWSRRNERDWSTSQTLRTGLIGPDYSSGNDRDVRTGNITFSWNALDFGLSYFAAKQKANTALMQAETERRVTNNILLEVVRAWYRAKTFHNLQPRLLAAERDARETLIAAEKAGVSQVENPLQALTFQRELVDTLSKIDSLKREFEIAKQTLNALLGRNPDAVIESFGADDIVMAGNTAPLDDLVDVAPLLRSEVRTVLYETQNEKFQDDARRLALLPLPRLAIDGNYSSNSFNLQRDWASMSLSLVGNLTRLALLPSASKSAPEKEALAASKLRAIVLAVKLQTYIAHRDFVAARKTQELNDRFALVSRRIAEQVRNARTADAASRRQLVREDVNLLWAEMRKATAEVEVRSAKYRLLLTAGVDLYEGAGTSGLKVADILKGDRTWKERIMPREASVTQPTQLAQTPDHSEDLPRVESAAATVETTNEPSVRLFGRLRGMFASDTAPSVNTEAPVVQAAAPAQPAQIIAAPAAPRAPARVESAQPPLAAASTAAESTAPIHLAAAPAEEQSVSAFGRLRSMFSRTPGSVADEPTPAPQAP